MIIVYWPLPSKIVFVNQSKCNSIQDTSVVVNKFTFIIAIAATDIIITIIIIAVAVVVVVFVVIVIFIIIDAGITESKYLFYKLDNMSTFS